MNDAKHFSSLNPIFAKETPAKGRKIYSTVTDSLGEIFNIVVDLTIVGNVITEVNYQVLGTFYGLSESDLKDMVQEIASKEDNSLTWEL